MKIHGLYFLHVLIFGVFRRVLSNAIPCQSTGQQFPSRTLQKYTRGYSCYKDREHKHKGRTISTISSPFDLYNFFPPPFGATIVRAYLCQTMKGNTHAKLKGPSNLPPWVIRNGGGLTLQDVLRCPHTFPSVARSPTGLVNQTSGAFKAIP